LLDGHMERSGSQRDGAPPARALLALRPLLSVRARCDRHARRRIPGPLHRHVSRVHALRARHAPLAGAPVSTLSRSARGWTELGAHVVLLLIGLGGMQVAAERTNRRIDLTPGRALSLAPATWKLLAEVTAPLRITVFFRRGTRERHADLVRLFADANPRIAFELLDLDRFPERARSLGVTSYGRAAIECGGRRAVVLAAPEEELSGEIPLVVHRRSAHPGLAAVVELFKRGIPLTDPDAGAIDTGVVLPSARTVDVGTEVPGVAAETIARTAPSAWTEHDPARARRGEEPSAEAGDTPGSAPVLVMAQVGADDGVGHRRGRLVVAGDADFASDAYLDLLGNRDLALNAIAWVAGE